MSFFVAAAEHRLRTAITAFRDSALYRFGWCYEQADDYADIARENMRQKLVEREEMEDVAEPYEPPTCGVHTGRASNRCLRAEGHAGEHDDQPDTCGCYGPYTYGCPVHDAIGDDELWAPPGGNLQTLIFSHTPSSPSSTIPPAQVDDEGGEAVRDIRTSPASPHPTVPVEVSEQAASAPSTGLSPGEVAAEAVREVMELHRFHVENTGVPFGYTYHCATQLGCLHERFESRGYPGAICQWAEHVAAEVQRRIDAAMKPGFAGCPTGETGDPTDCNCTTK